MKQSISYIWQSLIVVIIVLIINAIAQYIPTYFDLTEDSRFTLSESTIQLVDDVDDVILVKILLDGQFPAGFKRLQNQIEERIRQFANINSKIKYIFQDPSSGSIEEINTNRLQLGEIGVLPVRLMVKDGDEFTEKFIYPYAIISLGSRQVAVNLLEEQDRSQPQEVVINKSISLLEYKLVDGLRRLLVEDKPNIVIAEGFGSLLPSQTASLELVLKDYYDVGRVNLDSLIYLDQSADILMLAKPTQKIPNKVQFVIDQYIMNGGNVMWFVDQYAINLDSVNQNNPYIPKKLDIGMDDLWFKYGIRLTNDLVMDLECSKIPQVVAMQGDKPQTELFHWFYHPLVSSYVEHPITKGIDRVNLKFPSTLEVLDRSDVKATKLLQSSKFSKYQVYPMRLSFDILRIPPDETKYNKGMRPVAVLLEGSFDSYYTNRLSAEQNALLKDFDVEFKAKSDRSVQLFVSDGDVFKNLYNQTNNNVSPVGYNKWENEIYKGNLDFILNSIEYMLDEDKLLDARNKDLKLRLLNKAKINQETKKWQLINIALPLILVWLFALLFGWNRKRIYSKTYEA